MNVDRKGPDALHVNHSFLLGSFKRSDIRGRLTATLIMVSPLGKLKA